MEAWKGESYDLLSFMYHVCGNKIIVIVIVIISSILQHLILLPPKLWYHRGLLFPTLDDLTPPVALNNPT